MIKSACNVLSELFKGFAEFFRKGSTSIEHQSESTMLKELKRKKIAIDCAEQIIFITDSSFKGINNKYDKYRKKFFKYNS